MNDAAITQIIEKIRAARRILIRCHTKPDGDTLGSALALASAAATAGAQARLLVPDPIPARLRFLFTDETILYCEEEHYESDLIISVDVASPEQLGSLQKQWCDRVDIKIDHHLISPPFGKLCWVEPEAAAAGELIFEIARRMDALKDAADPLYAAIASDTGSFRFENVTDKTYTIAACLKQNGADTARISAALFDNLPMREAIAAGDVYSHMTADCGGKFVRVMILNERKRALGTTDEDYGNASALLRSINGVLLAVAVKQDDKNEKRFKISMRSTAPIDCAALCSRLGGGGHIRAAGASLCADTPEEAEQTIAALCREAFYD